MRREKIFKAKYKLMLRQRMEAMENEDVPTEVFALKLTRKMLDKHLKLQSKILASYQLSKSEQIEQYNQFIEQLKNE
jgi:ABC-type phosphate transport system auxiliary subunit